MKHQQGFILVMTLVMMGIIMLLLLTSMQHILLYQKAINAQELAHQKFYQLENVTMRLAQMSLNTLDPACITHEDRAIQAIQQLTQQGGCSLNIGTEVYRYLIEDLGTFSCMKVYKNGQKRAAFHRRVSVLRMEKGNPSSLLQLRFVTLGPVLNCLTEEHTVGLGVSSWRYFSLITRNIQE